MSVSAIKTVAQTKLRSSHQAWKSWRSPRYPRVRLVPIFLSLALFGAAIELVQALPNPGREPSWMDRLADLTAAAAVLIFVGAVRLIRQAR